MDPEDLVNLGTKTSRQTWASIGVFMDEYLDVLDAEGVLDYSELIHRAVLLSYRPDVQEYLHKTFSAIYVDEYQDTDPGQVALLKAMVNVDSALVVVGDVDQAIYGFRGADEAGIRNFEHEFETVFGKPSLASTAVEEETAQSPWRWTGDEVFRKLDSTERNL
jgi:superfamily I DNA/RNA helicase